MVDASRTSSAIEPRCHKCGNELGSAYIYGTDGKMYCWACFPASPSATRIAQLERDLAEARAERDDMKGVNSELIRHAKAVGMSYREDEFGAPYFVNIRAEAAERERNEAQSAHLAICNTLGLQATANAHLDAAQIKAERDRLAAEVERLLGALREIISKDRTGYGRGALARVARAAVRASLQTGEKGE